MIIQHIGQVDYIVAHSLCTVIAMELIANYPELIKQGQKNNGEVPKYYATGCHPAIVDKNIWNRVHEKIARRDGKRKVLHKQTRTGQDKYNGKYALSELLVFGDSLAAKS